MKRKIYKQVSSMNNMKETQNTDRVNGPCAIEECAKRIREQRGLPKNAFVPIMMVCRCPRCYPRFKY